MAFITFQPKDYFNTKLYTGNGSTNAITGVGFQPDFVWQKSRSAGEGHGLFDAVRGVTNRIQSNTNGANSSQAGSLTAFGSDGFTVGGSPNNDAANGNGQTFVSWNWKANGQGSSNTDGSINTTYTSANTTSGCAIITYTGTGANATIGHGLGKIPTFIIFRRYAQAENWNVYHKSVGAAKSLRLNETGAQANDTTALNSTTPTSSLITLGTSVTTNANGNPMIAWCFTDIQGFSRHNSYIGNGSKDGAFIFTGFKPAFVMCRKFSGADNWMMFTNKISSSTGTDGGYNIHSRILEANGNGAEQSVGTGDGIDFLSNGFKIREDNGNLNGSGASYLFMSFAENPFVTSTGIPTTAR